MKGRRDVDADVDVLRAKLGAKNGGVTSEVDVLRAKLAEAAPTRNEAETESAPHEEVPENGPDKEPVAEPESRPHSRAQAGQAVPRPARGRAARRERGPERGRETRAADHCEIEWWIERSKSQFVAVIADGDERRPIAMSASFRRRNGDPPEEREPATAALGELVERLQDHGWMPVGKGKHWFALEFAREARSNAHDRRGRR